MYMKKISLREWLGSNRVTVIERVNFDRDGVMDAVCEETGEVVGKFYPNGYDRLDAFVNIGDLSDVGIREKRLRIAARNFFMLNQGVSLEKCTRLALQYFKLVSDESNLGLSEYEIRKAINWGVVNTGEKGDFYRRSYFTFNVKLDNKRMRSIICKYNAYKSNVRSILDISSAIDYQMEGGVFITKNSTLREVNIERDKQMSPSTIKNNWKYFKEDVERYNTAYFGCSSWHKKKSDDKYKAIVKSYVNGNTTKMSVHKDTGISRITIDKYWSIITM